MLNCALLGLWIGSFPWFPNYKNQWSRQAAGYKQEHINTKTIIESITIFFQAMADGMYAISKVTIFQDD